MKKKALIVLAAVFLAAALVLLGWSALRPSCHVALTLQNVSPTAADLTIRNQSRETLELGEDYAIQRHDGKGWTILERQPGQGFGLVAYSLLPGESRVFPLDWSNSYGALPPGRYRVCKDFSLRGLSMTCRAEFTIEK